MSTVRAVDAHCHLNLFEDPLGEMALAMNSGIECAITCGGSLKDSVAAASLTRLNGVYAAVGIDPSFASEWKASASEIDKIAKQKSIVAIGEIGLDYKMDLAQNTIELQRKVFAEQIKLASELSLPVVVHARGAMKEVLGVLDNEHAERVMLHYFDGGVDEALEAQNRGYIISVPPFKSKNRSAAIEAVSIDSLVCETDAPVVGKHVSDVLASAQIIAGIKAMSVEDVAATTGRNAKLFFGI